MATIRTGGAPKKEPRRSSVRQLKGTKKQPWRTKGKRFPVKTFQGGSRGWPSTTNSFPDWQCPCGNTVGRGERIYRHPVGRWVCSECEMAGVQRFLDTGGS